MLCITDTCLNGRHANSEFAGKWTVDSQHFGLSLFVFNTEKNKLHEIRLASGDSTTSATQTDASMMPSSPMSTRNSPKLWLEEEAAWL